MDLARLGFSSQIIPGAWRCSGRNNDEMVDKFVHSGLIVSKEVEDSFRAVPRGAFVPPEQQDEAYYDSPLRGDPHVHMSAPHMYATVLEALDLCPGLSFLNVGSGTGYFNCLVGYIIKRNSINHGIEQYDDLVDFSRERCEEFIRFSPMAAREMSSPVFLAGNCFRLDTRNIQYDRIYCGAACPHSKLPFILSMTKVRGFAIIPCKNKLLKIERVSTTGVKLSVIREVSFASLSPLPESEASQPKLKFPPAESKKKQKLLKVFPSSNLLVSNGHSRKTLAKLRALQEACECLKDSQPLPIPFCYVPSEQHLKDLKTMNKIKPTKKELKTGKETQTGPSPVDGKITFFTSCTKQDGGYESIESDIWDFLYLDNSWESVLENYYSICNVSPEKKSLAMNLYVKKKKISLHVKPTKTQSYADLMSKIGLPLQSMGQKAPKRQECGSGERALGSDGCDCIPLQNNGGSPSDEDGKGDDCSVNNECVAQGSTANEDKMGKITSATSVTVENNLTNVDVKDSRGESLRLLESCTSGMDSCHEGKDSIEGKQGNDGENTNNSKDCSDVQEVSDNKESGKKESTCGSDIIDKVDGKKSDDSKDCCDVQDVSDDKESGKKESAYGTDIVDKVDDTHGKKADDSKDSLLEQDVTDGKDSDKKESTCSTDISNKENDIDDDSSAQTTSCNGTSPLSSLESSTTTANDKTSTNKAPLVPTNLFSKNLDINIPNSPTTSKNSDETSDGKKDDIEHSKSKKSDYDIVKLEVDRLCMDKISSVPNDNWCIEDDMELVRFLSDVSDQSSKGRCKGWFKAELVRPKLFSGLDGVVYPRLVTHNTEDLAFRAVALCRVAKVLDSLLYLLSGPSLLKDIKISPSKYPLDSFGDWSFESSRVSTEMAVERQSCRTSKEEMLHFEEVISERDAEQLRVQHELTSKKLKLTQDLQDQIREQQKVLKKQAALLEEKQVLVQNLRSLDIKGSQQSQTSESPDVTELKTQRQATLSKIQKLVEQHTEQDTKKNRLVEELKRLREQRNKILQTETRKKEETAEATDKAKQQQTTTPYNETTSTRRPSSSSSPSTVSRYQLSYLLPQLRFLLPLCRQRWRIVQEMLHVSELSAPDHMSIVTVDRRTPLHERGSNPDKSVLLQVYKELRPEKLNYRWNKWKYDQWWEVKFIGEGIIDQGGGFRDSLVEIADEICPPERNSPEVLPLFVKTPNNKDNVGDYQDSYIPNSSCKQWLVYEWLGKLFGAVYRSDENLTLACPPLFWKMLIGAHVTWAKDFAPVDDAAVRFTDELEVMDEELYLATYSNECKFSTVLSDGTRVDLIPDGENKEVMSCDRHRFAFLLREARMTESVKQVLAIRKGLLSVIPETVLRLLTWNELERGICGNPDVSLDVLKGACKYGDDLSESTECIKHLWTALGQFTNDERSRFLRFVTGRRRPPAPFTVAKAGGGSKDALPHASTCASSLFWPNYPSAALASARLRYAIYNCIAIDTDTNPW